MLDRLPLELIERVTFDPSPWITAERFAFLSAVSKRYQEIFRPHARRYLVVRSARTFKLVQPRTMKRRRLVKTLLAGTPIGGNLELLGLLPSVETVVLNHAAGYEDLIQEDGDDDPDPYEVPIVVSGTSPFRHCRTLVIDNSDTFWELEPSLGAQPFALEHLTVRIGSRARFDDPYELWDLVRAGALPNLKTLNLETCDPPDIPVDVINKLDYIQANLNGGLSEGWYIPSSFRQSSTPVLYTTAANFLGPGRPKSEGVFYVYIEPYWENLGRDLGEYLEAFPDLRAVFISYTSCVCDESTSPTWCGGHKTALSLAKRGVDVCWTSRDYHAPIEPDFIDYLKRKPHVPPPQRDLSSEAYPSP